MCLRFASLVITRVTTWLRLSRREEAWQTEDREVERQPLDRRGRSKPAPPQPPGDEHAVVGAADFQDVRREPPRELSIPHPVSRPAGQQAWRRSPKRRRDGRPTIEHWCVWLASV
jgi:hypothetical protein